MKRTEFKSVRKRLHKTQKEMAQLLGISIKAIHSYEQGWRSIPVSVERQVFFLLSRTNSQSTKKKNCWTIKKCPTDRKKSCPAYEFNSGKFCWFINGTICEGATQKSWEKKMNICRKCEVFDHLI